MLQKIEREWETAVGLKARVVLNNWVYPSRCGYVVAPNDVDVDNLRVHGGITFEGTLKGSDEYWIGFDAMHYNDAPDWVGGWKMCETEEEKQQFKGMQEMAKHGLFTDGVTRYTDYMVQECERLAEQLVKGK